MSDDLTCSGCGEYIGSHISDRIEAQAAEIKRLREALEEYGAHKNYGDIPCRKDAWDFEIPCTCGLDDVLKENSHDR
jgi:hypothetical protein